MEELAILFGLIIVITILLTYNRRRNAKCTKKMIYFDDYYDVPVLNAAEPDPDLSNKQVVNIKMQPRLMDETNSQASRWAGSVDSQPAAEDGHRQYTNTDCESETNHGMKLNERNDAVYSKVARSSIVNKFMDSELFDQQFIMNNSDTAKDIEAMASNPRYAQEKS